METTDKEQPKKRRWIPKGVHRLIIVLSIVLSVALGWYLFLDYSNHNQQIKRYEWQESYLDNYIQTHPESISPYCLRRGEEEFEKERASNPAYGVFGQSALELVPWYCAPDSQQNLMHAAWAGLVLLALSMPYFGLVLLYFLGRGGIRVVMWIADGFRNPE